MEMIREADTDGDDQVRTGDRRAQYVMSTV